MVLHHAGRLKGAPLALVVEHRQGPAKRVHERLRRALLEDEARRAVVRLEDGARWPAARLGDAARWAVSRLEDGACWTVARLPQHDRPTSASRAPQGIVI